MRWLALVSLGVVACGGTGPGPLESSEQPPAASFESALRGAHLASKVVTEAAEHNASLTVDAVFVASQLAATNQLTTYGTLSQSGDAFMWSPQPTDRLVADYQGKHYEFENVVLQGDFTSRDNFFSGSHRFEATVSVDAARLTLSSTKEGPAHEITVQGVLSVSGTAYELDLRSSGNEYFDVDSTGSSLSTDFLTQGDVRFDGVHLQLDERSVFELVSSGDTASSDVRTINSLLVSDGRSLRFDGVRLSKAFFNGKPNEIDSFWQATGRILDQDVVLGEYQLSLGPSTIDVVVKLEDARLNLESWQAY